MKEVYSMDDFFTLASFATLTGCVVAVVVIVNSLRHALNWGTRWFGLTLSILIAFVALQLTVSVGDTPKTVNLGWFKYLTVFVNGCLIYTSAFGIQNTVVVQASSESDISFQSVQSGTPQERAERLTVRSPW